MNYIYKLENPINHKVYIGCSNNPVKRWNHGKGYKANKDFFRDINEIGFDNFIHTIFTGVEDYYLAKTLEEELTNQYRKDTEVYNIRKTSNIKERKLNTKHSKPVLQYNAIGQFVKEYPSAAQAERETGIVYSSISRAATKYGQNGPLMAGGYYWAFK